MNRFLLTIIAIGAVAASLCAQPRITSDRKTHTMGQIEWKKPVSVDYTITNSGNKPLVLTNITTSCACAVADWTKTPIQPGKKGKVTVTFDAKALGRFNKSVGIYSNAQPSLIYLNFVGEVVRKVSDFSNMKLHRYGNILIDVNDIEFPDAHLGERPQITITVVNQSDQSYEPVLMHLPSYIEMTKEPSVLQRGEKGKITLTLNTDRLPDLGLTQTSVYLSRFAGDKVSDESEIPVSAILLPNFAGMSRMQQRNAPIIQLSETELDLRRELLRKDKVTKTLTIQNKGRSKLEISKLQVFNSALGVDLKKAVLQPGEKTKLKVTLTKKNLQRRRHLRILMFTNDPENPKVVININTSSN
ncbi:MAG: DUF1573 domain-containing protein [Bacteroides sp.]|nr:DUF1573 domain-containing protein [Bacteroides sp.]